MAYGNAMVASAPRVLEARHKRDALVAAAHREALGEFVGAALVGGDAPVRTPGYDTGTMTVSEIVLDAIGAASPESEALRHELVAVLALAAKGDASAFLRASALLAQIGKAHADMHATDLGELMFNAEPLFPTLMGARSES